MEHSIQTWLLVLTLFLPRISLFIAYLINQIPFNSVPFIGDLLLFVFLPRVLMLIYIVDNLGTSSPWFWIHLVVAIVVWYHSSKYAYKKKFKK